MPPRTDVVRRARVASAEWVDDERFEVRFDEIEDERVARELVGCHCLVERALVPAEPSEEDAPAWEGWRVEDGARALSGSIDAVRRYPGHDLLEIALEGRERPLLLPLVDEFVLEVDVAARLVRIAIPDGLLDL